MSGPQTNTNVWTANWTDKDGILQSVNLKTSLYPNNFFHKMLKLYMRACMCRDK